MDEDSVVRKAALQDADSGECQPTAEIPAWWSPFLFHVLNPRQISMYIYLIMLADERGICHPTIDQIRKDLGLLSTTMVFESIAVLEDYGFFVRSRQALPESRSRRNVYRRTTCEYTILRLLETNRVDAWLNPAGSSDGVSDESKQLVAVGVKNLLGDHFSRYEKADDFEKRTVLIDCLNQILRSRPDGIYFG